MADYVKFYKTTEEGAPPSSGVDTNGFYLDAKGNLYSGSTRKRVNDDVHVKYDLVNTPQMDGTASTGSATTIARSDHVHPTDTTRASKESLDNHTTDTTAHITSTERTDWNTAHTHSQSAHAPINAEKNQNAFSNITVGGTTISADSTTDTLTIAAGSNVTLTPDANSDTITVDATDTVYIHPSHTERSNGLYKITVDKEGHVTDVTAVDKSHITALGIPAQDTVYAHPSYTDYTGKPAADQTPAFGGTATVSQITSDANGHVTTMTDRTIKIPDTLSNGDSTVGLIRTSSTVTSSNGYTACPVISGVPYYKDTNTDTDTTYDLAASASSPNGHVKLNLTAGGSGSGTDSVTIKGGGATTVTTDASGVVTISSTYTDTVYTHPAPTETNQSTLYKIEVDSTGHVTDTVAVTKEDITALGIPAQDTVYTHSENHDDRYYTETEIDSKLSTKADTHTHPYIPTAEKGVASGVATLDSTGKVPTEQLPDILSVFTGGGSPELVYTVKDNNLSAAEIKEGSRPTKIVIPDYWMNVKVTDIASELCKNLDSITSASVGSNVTTISAAAFYNCYSLTNVTIGDSVTSIGNSAFQYCYSLTSVTIPDSVTSIGDKAFYNCDALTSVTIGDSVTSIGKWAFYNCNSLTSITIPDSVTSIDYYAFQSCADVTTITVEAGNSKYHSAGNCLIETINKILIRGCNNSLIPTDGSVTFIQDYAFDSCSNLTSITIPDSVTSIGYSAFQYCSSLTSVTIGDSVTTIGDFAFKWCRNLTSVTIPHSVTTIGDHAFYGCTNITTLLIPNSVTSIGSQAFGYSSSLKQISLTNSVENVASDFLEGCDNLQTIRFYGTRNEFDSLGITVPTGAQVMYMNLNV